MDVKTQAFLFTFLIGLWIGIYAGRLFFGKSDLFDIKRRWHRRRAIAWELEHIYLVGLLLDIKPGSPLYHWRDLDRKRAAVYCRCHRMKAFP